MKKLIVITGPTGVGKTDVAIEVAERYSTEIVSADSRQIYKGLPIGTAAPDEEQLKRVKHHFVGILELDEYYSAAQFESDALRALDNIFATHDYAVLCGGSMMYVDAICKGIDDIPTISQEIRDEVMAEYTHNGIDVLKSELERLDPEYYRQVDLNNHKRVIHAIEICRQAGIPYSKLRTGKAKPRPFEIVKYGVNLPRPILFDRINRRVDKMIERGLEQEARSVYHLRHLNSLNTVGYKEMFACFDGTMDFLTACERLKKNTRVYAKKQLTWYAKDPDIHWIEPCSDLIK